MLRLRYVDGLGSKEIAERLGKNDDAVRAAVSRALRQLQAKLRESTS
jgi:RNA polymerase sigma-70 factor (ECF subfamily)